MKEKLTLLIFFALFSSKAFTQNCTGDSVVIVHRFEEYGNSNEINTDSFDVLTGSVVRCHRGFGMNGNVYASRSIGTFTRYHIERNGQNDTTSFYSFNGTGTGYTYQDKRLLTYDPLTNFITSRLIYRGSGTTWAITSQEDYTYNSDNNLIEYVQLKDNGSGTLENLNKTSYNYTGSRLDDIVYQTGQGSTWNNSIRYTISYNASDIRDSLSLETWDTTLVNWFDSAKYNYNPLNNYYVQLYMSNTYFDTINNYFITDTICLVLDTLNLPISYYSDLDAHVYINEFRYGYINNKQVLLFSSSNDGGCFIENTNSFDANGVKIAWGGPSNCFMSAYHTGSINYDPLYRPRSSETYSSVGSGDYHYYNRYNYADPNSISFRYLSVEDMNYIYCDSDSMNTGAIVLGGCGPYHFQWTPSTGLSSDTVKEPKIFINDTLTYFITVTDSVGNTASTTLFTTPYLSASITLDSTSCMSCPYSLVAHYYSPSGPTSVLYQWYRNDSAIAGATQQIYLSPIAGIYRVEIRTNFPPNCTSSSVELYFIPNKIEEPEFMNISIYPNPAKDIATIKGLPKDAVIKMFDLTGRCISFQGEWNSNDEEFKINTSSLKSSFYFIDIEYREFHSQMNLIVLE